MLISKFEVDKTKYGISSFKAKFFACLVSVNASDSIASVMKEINDNSWIAKLDVVEQISYEARLKETVKSIMNDCIKFNTDTNSNMYDYSVVGEYIVSKEGRSALVTEFNHQAVPLAELWKEKTKGNPGFDYHSESTTNLIIFGEAKYDSSFNPHTKAIKQVEEFITKAKDCMELTDLKHFVSDNAIDNFKQSKKGFSIAFSVKAQTPTDILNNAILSNEIMQIKNYEEFYIIGVVINDK